MLVCTLVFVFLGCEEGETTAPPDSQIIPPPETDDEDTADDQDPSHTIIEKGNGVVHLVVEQAGEVLIDETYTPQNNTNWVQDNGIVNGFYLKAGVYNPAAAHTEEIDMQYTAFSFESEDN